jgi:hypothetical protein
MEKLIKNILKEEVRIKEIQDKVISLIERYGIKNVIPTIGKKLLTKVLENPDLPVNIIQSLVDFAFNELISRSEDWGRSEMDEWGIIFPIKKITVTNYRNIIKPTSHIEILLTDNEFDSNEYQILRSELEYIIREETGFNLDIFIDDVTYDNQLNEWYAKYDHEKASGRKYSELNDIINRVMRKKHDWWIDIDIDKLGYAEVGEILEIWGKITVDKKWAKQQHKKRNTRFAKFPTNDDHNKINSIVPDETIKTILNQLKTIITSTTTYKNISRMADFGLTLHFQ